MAIIYITSNASSGTGTLRQAILDASPGDVIKPAPELEGATITLASILNVSTAVTIEGGAKRLTIDGGGSYYVYFNASDGETVVRDVSFVRLKNSTSAGAGSVRVNTPHLLLERVLVAGCETKNGGAFHLGVDVQSFVAKNCAAIGNHATTSAGVAYFSNGKEAVARFWNCSLIGNLPSTSFNAEPTLDDCKTDTTGLVSPPPASWDESTWTSTAWEAWNVHVLSSSPDASGHAWGSLYDLEGNPRILGTLGAFETIEADLYWIGLDANGDPVASPSLASADGWATDRWATTSGTTVPNDVLSLYVGQDVTFAGTWEPSEPSRLTLGRGNVFATFAEETTVFPGTGVLSFTGKVIMNTSLSDFDVDLAHFAPVAPATLDLSGSGSDVVADAFVVPSGVHLLVAYSRIDDLTINGGSLTVAHEMNTTSFSMSSGVVELETDAFLHATSATVTGGSFVAFVPPRGYVSLPSTSAVSATFTGATRLCSDANASQFRADTTGTTVSFGWSADLATCLEKVSPFEQLATAVVASDAPTTNVYVPTTFRLWSGNEWLLATATPRIATPYWTVEKWGIVRAEVEDVAFNVSVWGLSPDVIHEGE